MKKILLLSLLLLIFTPLTNAKASPYENLPIKKQSKQWLVVLDKPQKGYPVSDKNGAHSYSLTVNNIGKDIFSVEINMFRNEPHSTMKYSLFGCPDKEDCHKHLNLYKMGIDLAKSLNAKYPYKFANFTLSDKATELEVEIVWTEIGMEGRSVKERFIIPVNRK